MPDLPHLPAPSTTTSTRPPSAADPADSPLGRLLLHPDATLGRWAHQLVGLLDLLRHPLVPILAAVALLGVPTVAWLAGRWRQARLAQGARWVQVLPPPVVEPPAAEVLWANLGGLLRSRRWRLAGRPHVAFELRWTIQGLAIGVWVPGTIAPRMVERAIEAAWPGARTDTTAPSPPLPLGQPAVGGTLRLAQTQLLPLRTEHWVDPLRALLGAAGELAAGETACVQITARPASARHRPGWAAGARRGAGGILPRAVGALLDLVTPGPVGPGRRRAAPAAADPVRAADARAMAAKAQGPGWEVGVRYGAAAAGPVRDAGQRGRLRARAHALAAAFEVHTGPAGM